METEPELTQTQSTVRDLNEAFTYTREWLKLNQVSMKKVEITPDEDGRLLVKIEAQ